jgi:hypothetical protein
VRSLPYDVGNFAFSSKPGLTQADQEEAIYNLNQNVLQSGPTPAAEDLIAGWYATSHTLDVNYLPPSWQGLDATATSFYHNVVGHSCRTCHVNMIEGYNFDHRDNLSIDGDFYRVGPGWAPDEVAIATCKFGVGQPVRNFTMPNSLVTFNRFWQSVGAAVDQPDLLSQYLGLLPGTFEGPCLLGP